jgi:hypothetical protein
LPYSNHDRWNWISEGDAVVQLGIQKKRFMTKGLLLGIQCSHCFSSEQHSLLRLDAVELKLSRRHFGANGVVKEKPLAVARWFSIYVLELW